MSALNVSSQVIERAKKIKLLLMDVDGVMTDGRLYYLQGADGQMQESKGFNSHDGIGLHLCHDVGIPTGVISGRTSPATVERASILHMRYVYQGRLEKVGAWEEILKDANVSAAQTAYIGDDLPDVPLIQRAGLGVATANARREVKQIADLVTAVPGGEGAVREVIEVIFKAQGLWEKAIAKYFKTMANVD